MLQHHPVVGRQIGFAFGAIEDEVFAVLVRRRREFDHRREARTAHAADAGRVHTGEQLLLRGRLPVERGKGDGGRGGLVVVGFEDDRVGPGSRGALAGLDRLDRAGRGREHGHRDEAVALAEKLSLGDVVADLDDALGVYFC